MQKFKVTTEQGVFQVIVKRITPCTTVTPQISIQMFREGEKSPLFGTVTDQGDIKQQAYDQAELWAEQMASGQSSLF